MAEQQAQPLLKFSAHHYRAEGVDEQAFAKWYTEEQIPRMIKIIQKHGILHYRLVRLNLGDSDLGLFNTDNPVRSNSLSLQSPFVLHSSLI